jgi:hypothetical protein
MKPFNRERFLLYLLAGLLGWQATIFSFGVVLCSRVTPLAEISTVCPELGNRFDKFVQTTLGAVLGLLAGAAALSTNQRKPSTSDPVLPSDGLPHQRPQLPQSPFSSPDREQASAKKPRKP